MHTIQFEISESQFQDFIAKKLDIIVNTSVDGKIEAAIFKTEFRPRFTVLDLYVDATGQDSDITVEDVLAWVRETWPSCGCCDQATIVDVGTSLAM